LASTAVFKTAALNHSATCPLEGRILSHFGSRASMREKGLTERRLPLNFRQIHYIGPMPKDVAIPAHANACLMLADGTVFFGESIGAESLGIGEICFNTGMPGYQETLTDPSYAGQIIAFTFPHIGNVGCNDEDIEANKPFCAGLVVRERPTM